MLRDLRQALRNALRARLCHHDGARRARCVSLYVCGWLPGGFHYRPHPGNDHDLRARDRLCGLGRAGGRRREPGRLPEFAAGLLERHSASGADR